MKNQVYVSVAAVALSLSVGACDDGSTEPSEALVVDNTEISEEVTNREIHDNGEVLNGVQFNGVQFNGDAFGGLAGMFLGNVKVVKSKLEAIGTDGITYRGNSLANVEISMIVNSTLQRLRINSVVADVNDPDIVYTNLSYKKGDGTWDTWCRDGYGNPTEAIVVEGAYDTNGNFVADNGAVAFACRGTASAKCIVWGYKPWDEVGGVSLRNHYQACLAMVRGDYCRANTPHTVNGTPIDISDHGLPSQINTSGTNWPVEAQWGVNGAVCFSTPRKLIYPRDSINPCYSTIPTCPADKNTWRAGALLMTQANPG